MPNFRALLPGFMKQMQCNALKIETAAKQREYPQKSYFQATQKNTSNFPNQKNPGIKNFKPKRKHPSVIPITWNPENPLPPARKTEISHWMDN